MSYLDSLLEKRANVWNSAKEILDRAEAEKRELTAEEQSGYDTAMSDMGDLAARADKLKEDAEASRRAEEALRSLASQPQERAHTDESETEKEVRKFLNGEVRSIELKPSAAEKRDLTKGTTTAGGHTVPTSFYGQLLSHLRDNAALIQAGATVITTDSGESLEIPVTTSHGAGALVAEAGALAESDPAFAKRTLGAYKYGQLIQVSRELVDDTGVDLLGYLAKEAGINIGNAFGTHLVTGDGSSKPTGIMTTAAAGVTGAAAAAGVPTFDNLIDLFYSVIAPYRASSAAAWLLRDASAGYIRKMKDGDNNYIWQPSVIAGQPDLLLSKPGYTDPNVAAIAADAESILFGDISRYFVRLVNGIRFERSDEYAFNTDLVTFRAVLRGDGLLVDQTGAVKTFTGGAAA